MRATRRRRGPFGGFLAACCVAVGVLMGAAPGSAQAQEPKVVIDFARAGCTSAGCGAVRPARWLPDRTPRQGLGIGFYRVRWSNWNRPQATGRGQIRICAGSSCSRSNATFVVYRPVYVVSSEVYSCMRFTRTRIPELRGARIKINPYLDPGPRC